MKFVTWLTSAPVHLQFAIATGDLPLRKSETKLPGVPDLPVEVPGGEGLRREPRTTSSTSGPTCASYAQVSTAVGQMVQSVLLGQAQPADALKSGSSQVTAALAGS